MKKILSLLVLSVLMSGVVFSQKIQLVSGNLSKLKNEKFIEVEFTYENLKVGKMTEEDYINKRLKEFEEKGEDGNKWLTAWKNDRESRYAPKFIELFNKYSSKADITIDNSKENLKYKMIVNTSFLEPGYNIGISSKPSLIDLEITFVEISKPDKAIAKVNILKSKGVPHFDAGTRISESYAKAAKKFARTIHKYMK